MPERVLCVDDEPNVLQALQRQLRRQFQVETASGGAEALEMLAVRGPFAVIVSDMRMPGMDGIQFLSAAKERAPESVRIMLTGNADQQTAIDAVNKGDVFRFITKPCPPETLIRTLAAGVRQYQLVTAEKELVETTLRGSVKVLTDILSLTNPVAFGCASRVRQLVQRLCRDLKVKQAWQSELAAMLSQIGCVTIPQEALEKMYRGVSLTDEETRMFAAHPAVGQSLVANIPRLEPVAEIIAYQHKCFDGAGAPPDSVVGRDIPQGARILKVALDYDALKWNGTTDAGAIARLREQSRHYDPEVLFALETLVGLKESFELREVGFAGLAEHMTLAEDVKTIDGLLLVGKGQEVTAALRQRLTNFARNGRVEGPLRVLVPIESSARRPAAAGVGT